MYFDDEEWNHCRKHYLHYGKRIEEERGLVLVRKTPCEQEALQVDHQRVRLDRVWRLEDLEDL